MKANDRRFKKSVEQMRAEKMLDDSYEIAAKLPQKAQLDEDSMPSNIVAYVMKLASNSSFMKLVRVTWDEEDGLQREAVGCYSSAKMLLRVASDDFSHRYKGRGFKKVVLMSRSDWMKTPYFMRDITLEEWEAASDEQA